MVPIVTSFTGCCIVLNFEGYFLGYLLSMKHQQDTNTSHDTDPNTDINKNLRKWKLRLNVVCLYKKKKKSMCFGNSKLLFAFLGTMEEQHTFKTEGKVR